MGSMKRWQLEQHKRDLCLEWLIDVGVDNPDSADALSDSDLQSLSDKAEAETIPFTEWLDNRDFCRFRDGRPLFEGSNLPPHCS